MFQRLLPGQHRFDVEPLVVQCEAQGLPDPHVVVDDEHARAGRTGPGRAGRSLHAAHGAPSGPFTGPRRRAPRVHSVNRQLIVRMPGDPDDAAAAAPPASTTGSATRLVVRTVPEGSVEPVETSQCGAVGIRAAGPQGPFHSGQRPSAEPAPLALLQVPGDPVGGDRVVEFAVEPALQHPAVPHAAQQHPEPGHEPTPRGTTPAAASRDRIRERPRCSLLITVPRGTPTAAAASA